MIVIVTWLLTKEVNEHAEQRLVISLTFHNENYVQRISFDVTCYVLNVPKYRAVNQRLH